MKSSRSAVDTPWGKISYTGDLNEKTLLTMPNGEEIPFYSLISHTQGECLPYFQKPVMRENKSASIDEILDDIQFEWIEE